MIKLKYITLIMLIASITSCGKWLNVSDSNVILEEDLFKTEKGHKQQLVGVYNVMGSTSTYGSELSAGYVDALAHYWSINSKYLVKEFLAGNYNDAEVSDKLKATWRTMYEAIGNANVLLEKLGESNTRNFEDYDLMKGEALGLRAYLHFDLLRLFGPVIKNSPDGLSIPYYTKLDKVANPLLKASDVFNLIEKDLLAAKDLLANDPIKVVGRKMAPVNYSETTDPSNMAKNYRAIRMNYYAVVGSLARLYQLKGDNAKAYQYAKEVIDAKMTKEKPIFGLLEREDVTTGLVTYNDRIFSREIVFALYDKNLKSKMGVLGSFSPLSGRSVMLDKTMRQAIYVTASEGSESDYRLANWFSPVSQNYYFQRYFRDANDVATADPVLSMIQLSEMYYIAAEAKLGVDNAEALELLNKVRVSRNLSALPKVDSQTELAEHIFDESRKEYLGTGKLFYSYKRLYKNIKLESTVMFVTDQFFTLPLPQDELEFGRIAKN